MAKKDAVPMDERAIIIKTDAQLGTIDDNFEELKVAVAKKVMKYQGLVFADEDIKEAKSTKAELKKMIDTIEDNRKAIKRKWNDPYVEFEKKVKDIIALIEKPMMDIDVQIRDFEQRRIEAKDIEVRAQIEACLAGVDSEVQEFVRGCGIEWDSRWLNATVSMKKVTEDIHSQIQHIIADIESLQDICEDDEMLPEILGAYQDTKDLAGSLQKRKAILAQRETVRKMQEAAEARKKAAAEAEAERQRGIEEQARLRQEEENHELVINAADTPQIEDLVYSDEDGEDDEEAGNVQYGAGTPPPVRKPSLFRVSFYIDADIETQGLLVKFMNENNIQFKIISQQKLA